jgi:lysophospholipase L1-like esterase
MRSRKLPRVSGAGKSGADSYRDVGSFIARAAKIIVINLLVLVALLVPAELIFGSWFSPAGAISLSFGAAPNMLRVFSSPLYPDRPTIIYRRNANGFRGPDVDPAHIDIVTIGGSTTNELWLAEEDTWTAKLQTFLRQRGCPETIANSGIDGYTTQGHIASFDGWFDRIPGLKPRFVLAYIGINDVALDANAPRQRLIKGSDTGPLDRLSAYVAANSAVYRLYSQLRGWWHARRAGLAHGMSVVRQDAVWQAAPLSASQLDHVRAEAAGYRGRLEQLNARIRAFGARPIYVTQLRIDGRQVDGTWQQTGDWQGAISVATLQALNRELLGFCREKGEMCVDLAGKLVIPTDEFYDPMHTTPTGSARIAHFLADQLAPIVCGHPG